MRIWIRNDNKMKKINFDGIDYIYFNWEELDKYCFLIAKKVMEDGEKFDRIVMPLPKTGEFFLPLALKKAKPGSTIHLYAFLDEKEIPEEKKKIKALTKGYKTQISKTVKCGQFSPYVFRICFDIKIKN